MHIGDNRFTVSLFLSWCVPSMACCLRSCSRILNLLCSSSNPFQACEPSASTGEVVVLPFQASGGQPRIQAQERVPTCQSISYTFSIQLTSIAITILVKELDHRPARGLLLIPIRLVLHCSGLQGDVVDVAKTAAGLSKLRIFNVSGNYDISGSLDSGEAEENICKAVQVGFQTFVVLCTQACPILANAWLLRMRKTFTVNKSTRAIISMLIIHCFKIESEATKIFVSHSPCKLETATVQTSLVSLELASMNISGTLPTCLYDTKSQLKQLIVCEPSSNPFNLQGTARKMYVCHDHHATLQTLWFSKQSVPCSDVNDISG